MSDTSKELDTERKLEVEEDDDQELDEEGLRQKMLRSPYARLLDPTFRK